MGWTNAGGWSGRGWGRAAAVAATTTLNPSDKSTNVTLSAGNLAAQNSVGGTREGVRSVASFSGSKRFYSAKVVGFGLNNGFIGIGTGSVGLTSGDVLFVAGSGIAVFGDGSIWWDGASNGTLGTVADGDVIDIAIDDSAKKAWFRRNGGSWNGTTDDPATGTGGKGYTATGSLYAYISPYENAYTITANFGGSAYTYAAPSGFSNL